MHFLPILNGCASPSYFLNAWMSNLSLSTPCLLIFLLSDAGLIRFLPLSSCLEMLEFLLWKMPEFLFPFSYIPTLTIEISNNYVFAYCLHCYKKSSWFIFFNRKLTNFHRRWNEFQQLRNHWRQPFITSVEARQKHFLHGLLHVDRALSSAFSQENTLFRYTIMLAFFFLFEGKQYNATYSIF